MHNPITKQLNYVPYPSMPPANNHRWALLPILLSLAGCMTGKAYEGKRLPSSEIATVYAQRIPGFKQEKTFHIEKVDEMTVGDPARGWPSEVKVLPGNRMIIGRYFEYNRIKGFAVGLTQTAAGVLGGAVGGAVVGGLSGAAASGAASAASQIVVYEAAAPVQPTDRLRFLSFKPEAGRDYTINFSTGTDIKVWIQDDETGQIVGKEIEQIAVYFPKLKRKERTDAVANATVMGKLNQAYYAQFHRWPASQAELQKFQASARQDDQGIEWKNFTDLRFTSLPENSLLVSYRTPPQMDGIKLRVPLPVNFQ